MSIRGDIEELKRVEAEIKNLNNHVNIWRKRRTDIKKRISDYFESRNEPGAKDGNIAIICNKKERSVGKKKKEEKVEDSLYILKKHGVHDARNVLEEILKTMKGPTEIVSDVKIRKIKS
jgi:hypothetical protein